MDLQSIMEHPCRVENVVIVGLKRTKEYIVIRELEDLRSATSLAEIQDRLLEAHDNLIGLGIFDAVDITIDKGKKSSEGCVVVVRLTEDNLLGLRSGSYVQGNEGTVEASLNLSNGLGHAEQIAAGLEYGSQHTNLCSLTCSIPKPLGMPLIGDFRLQQLITDRRYWSSYLERLRGAMLTVTSLSGQHSLSYEWAWRRLSDPGRMASPAIISELGDHVKSAIKYSFFTHRFDDLSSPRDGWSLRATSEFAGVGFDAKGAKFLKLQLQGQYAIPVDSVGTTFHVEGSAGVILPWHSQFRTRISDRFFLGGICPDGLRGFRMKGVGPSAARRPAPNAADDESQMAGAANRDAIGGDLCGTILAALRFNLPGEFFRSSGIRGQLFLNWGNVSSLADRRSVRETVSDFMRDYRCSMGAGIIWAIPVGRLEINIARVLRSGQFDQVKNGIQFGFSTS